jgi:hypothetical protein
MDLPDWAKQPAHIVERADGKFAIAVGSIKVENVPLARRAAGNRARLALIRLLKEKPTGDVSGTLDGSRETNSFVASDGTTYVEVEVPVSGVNPDAAGSK